MYVFLTACRNEQLTMPTFLSEFAQMLARAGIGDQARLYVVDDLSSDDTVSILEGAHDMDLRVISAPTNLGNQGAMFYGLRQIQLQPEDTLITFDSDGEDDVGQIPSILALAAQNPGKVVLIERGRRRESLSFKVFFACYKLIFRFFTRQTIVPNNFLAIPGALVPSIQNSPLASVHFAYAILKLRPAHVSTIRDRRTRYGGQSSQNLFMLVSHGLVGLMVFFEVVVAKIFMLLFMSGGLALSLAVLAIALPAEWIPPQRLLIWSATMTAIGAVGLFSLLMSAALALVFKLAAFNLVPATAAQSTTSTLQVARSASKRSGARDGRRDREAS